MWHRVWSGPVLSPTPTRPRRLLCSPLCQIQPCCTPGPSSGTPGSLLFGLALCCSPAWSLSLPGLSQGSPLFPQGLDGGSSLSCLVHLSIPNTTIGSLSSSRTFHSSPLPPGEIPHALASLPDPHLLLLNCSNQTCPCSFPQTLSAFLPLCLYSLC